MTFKFNETVVPESVLVQLYSLFHYSNDSTENKKKSSAALLMDNIPSITEAQCYKWLEENSEKIFNLTVEEGVILKSV